MKKYIYFLSFFLSCGLSTKFYCEVKNLTWQQIVKEAKQKNPQLQQTIINFNQARIKLESIKSEFYPQISLSASTSKNLHKEYEPEVGYSYNLSAGITLFSGFSRVNNLKAQIIEMEIMQESYKRTLANLIASLKENYIDVYYTQESINLSEKILQRRRQNYELVKLKYASGKEDIGALLRVEADMLQAEYELNRAKRALEVALRTLLKNIGEEQIFMIKIVDKIEDTNDIKIEDLLKKDVLEIILETPEYKIDSLRLEKAKIQAKNYTSIFYPTLTASAVVGWSSRELIPEFDKWNLSLNMRLSYIIFNGFKNLNDLKIANNNIKTAEFELYNTKLSLMNNFYNLKINFIDNKELITVREKYLKALEKQAEIITVKYANGLATYYDWYQTEDSLVNIQRSLLNLKKQTILSKISIEKFLAYIE